MNAVQLITDGYRKIFSGPDALLKNISLFALTGLMSVISIYFENFKQAKTMPPDMSMFFWAIAGAIVIGIYLGGYTYKFMHKAFFETEKNLLPDFDMAPIGIFLKALPLVIVWIIYLSIMIGIVAVGTAISMFIGIVLGILFLCMAVFLSFIFVAYCENFDAKGLFNITLPFKFIGPTIGILALLGLLFIPVGILSMVPSFLVGLILGIAGYADTNIPAYVGGLLGGYLGCVAQLVWYYCLVQVYKEKLRPMMLERSAY